MATQITNKATLNYKSGDADLSTTSNTAVITLQGPLEVQKTSLEDFYRIGEDITYNIFITNSSANPLTNISIVDDLGTYVFSDTKNLTPLTYKNPAKLFINNNFENHVTGTTDDESVTFTISRLDAGATMLLQYKATVNQYADAKDVTSTLENVVSVTAAGINVPVVTNNTLLWDSYASVEVTKTMAPDPVVDNSPITYTFSINNYGTLPATSVVLTDVFTTLPNINSVSVDGTVTSDYTYVGNTFTYPAGGSLSTYTIPAATFVRDQDTGIVTTTPGTSTVLVQGNI